MMDQADQPFEIDEFRAVLIDGRLLENGTLHLTENKPAFPRQPHVRRWHYHVRVGQKSLCHLIVGMNLATVYERARDFAAACPPLACPPLLFRERKDGIGFLCLEHFEGESLDTLIAEGRGDAGLWLQYVRRAQNLLESSGQKSSEAQLIEEVRSLIQRTCEDPGLSEFDTQFLHGPAQRAILSGALGQPSFQRWTNGDFVGRNLLADSQGNLRLIDYEYAELTHFGDGDWLRLWEFSTLPPELDEKLAPELKAARQPWAEVRMWVHHLSQLKDACPSMTVTQHRMEAVGRLVRAIAGTFSPGSPGSADSWLIRLLAQHQLQTQSLVDQRSAWAQSLEVELHSAQAHFKQLSQEHVRRLAWANSLDAELHSTRESFEQLSEEHAKRTAWANALNAELQITQGHFAKLTREFDERTAWALSLQSELQTIRSAQQEQSQIISTLSAARERLVAERAGQDQGKANLEEDLLRIKNLCVPLMPLSSSEVHQEAVALLEQIPSVLADLKRDVSIRQAEANRLTALLLDAKCRAESAESEASRLTASLEDAQLHIDGLLARAVNLQEMNRLLVISKSGTEKKLGHAEHQLVLSTQKLEALEAELARYKSSLICRWAARSTMPKPHMVPPSQS
ncbi:MAG: hypothetical protein ABI273_09300 [Lacunisphaera sp.]